MLCFICFFFSSRRRHTRYIGDWSSDVCSSDLIPNESKTGPARPVSWGWLKPAGSFTAAADWLRPAASFAAVALVTWEIGRASCRERGEVWGVGGAVKKKNRVVWVYVVVVVL